MQSMCDGYPYACFVACQSSVCLALGPGVNPREFSQLFAVESPPQHAENLLSSSKRSPLAITSWTTRSSRLGKNSQSWGSLSSNCKACSQWAKHSDVERRALQSSNINCDARLPVGCGTSSVLPININAGPRSGHDIHSSLTPHPSRVDSLTLQESALRRQARQSIAEHFFPGNNTKTPRRPPRQCGNKVGWKTERLVKGSSILREDGARVSRRTWCCKLAFTWLGRAAPQNNCPPRQETPNATVTHRKPCAAQELGEAMVQRGGGITHKYASPGLKPFLLVGSAVRDVVTGAANSHGCPLLMVLSLLLGPSSFLGKGPHVGRARIGSGNSSPSNLAELRRQAQYQQSPTAPGKRLRAVPPLHPLARPKGVVNWSRPATLNHIPWTMDTCVLFQWHYTAENQASLAESWLPFPTAVICPRPRPECAAGAYPGLLWSMDAFLRRSVGTG